MPLRNIPCHEWRADEAVRLHEKRKKAARAWAVAKKKVKAARETEVRVLTLEARNRREEEQRKKKHKKRVADVERREDNAAEKERAQAVRVLDIDRRERGLVETLSDFMSLADTIRQSARKVGFTDHPLVQSGLDSVEKMRELVGRMGGHQRQR